VNDIDEILDTFDLLGDWDQRYQFLVELGEQLQPMPETARQHHNKVKECMSQVWVRAQPNRDNPETLEYVGDCDTSIIKGVVALLIQLFSGKSPREIMDIDVDRLFTGLHLAEHLSPNRHVGVYAIVNKMKAQAAAFMN
jgi:cysteine desulfuration protein SufE